MMLNGEEKKVEKGKLLLFLSKTSDHHLIQLSVRSINLIVLSGKVDHVGYFFLLHLLYFIEKDTH